MDKLKSIVLNQFDAKENVIKYDFEQFKEIETCTLNRFEIDDEIINNLNKMNNLKTIIFSHCIFQCEFELKCDIENLMIIYGKNIKFEYIKNLNIIKSLMITNNKKIDIDELKVFENIEELSLFDCEIQNFSEIKNFKKLKILNLDGSKIDNENVLNEIRDRIKIKYNKTYRVGV